MFVLKDKSLFDLTDIDISIVVVLLCHIVWFLMVYTPLVYKIENSLLL